MSVMHFTDRLYYCDSTDYVAHIAFLTSGMWALHLLRPSPTTGEWEWGVDVITSTYDQAFSMIRHWQPNLLMQEDA